MQKDSRLSLSAVCLILTLASTACLRTRAQLRDEGDEDREAGKPVAAKVEDVQPQGQYVVDELKGELTRMNGRIEDLERAQRETGGQSEQVKKLESRISELERAQATMIEAMNKTREPEPAADPNAAYAKGKSAFESGNPDGAIESFTQYIKAGGKFTEDATFLRAESYFQLKQWKKAIVDYSKFPEKYSRSKRMPQALYKIGLSFENLGMKQDARDFYADLIEKFPRSPEAKKAKAKIKS